MTWLNETGRGSAHPNPATVPLGRIGGVLRKGVGWSATCFPMRHGDRTLLLTPQHVLDGAGSSNLLAVANVNVLNEGDEAIDLDAWRKSEEFDIAAVEVDVDLLRRWALWPSHSRTADISQLDPSLGHEIHVSSLPRPLPGAVTKIVPHAPPLVAPPKKTDWPGELVLPHDGVDGDSGSPVFMSNGETRFGFAGIVTSTIVDKTRGQHAGCAVLSSIAIEQFIGDAFGPV